MRKLLFVSLGIFLLCWIQVSLFAHGNGDGHDVSDPSGIQYDNISEDTALRRSTCRVFGTEEIYLRQALGYHNDLVVDNGDGIMDRRCYWSLVFMSAYTMRITSPLTFRGSPSRPMGEGVLVDLNTDATSTTGFVTFILDARGLGDCPIRFDSGVNATVSHLKVIVDNPRKAFCRSDGTTPIYTSLVNGHTEESSQSSSDELYASIDSSVIIQPALTFPEMGSGGMSGSGGAGSGGNPGTGGIAGTGGISGSPGAGGVMGTGGQSGSGGTSQSNSINETDRQLRRVDAGGCNY